MLLNNKFTISNGELAQIKFQEFCLKNGWECAEPLSSNLPYDFVVRNEKGKFQTIQVKQAYQKRKTKAILANVCKSGKSNSSTPYIKGDFDILAVYNKFNDAWYMIPYKQVSHIKRSISFTKKDNKWNSFQWNIRNTKPKKK